MQFDALRCSLIFVCAFCLSLNGFTQERHPPDGEAVLLERVRTLFDAGRWDAVVFLSPVNPEAPAEFDYCRGMALAHLQRWQEARAAFEAGREKAPRDARFPLELGGIAFKQARLDEARSLLKQAVRLDPTGAYGTDFLASIYFLDGNLEAALKLWNRVDKPQIQDVVVAPDLRINRVLLDHAFAFSPRSLLTLKEYDASRTMVESLGVFSSPRFDMVPRDDGTFDLRFRALEKNGWGNSWLEGLASLLRGAVYQTLYPEFFNMGGSAWNSRSLVRWDAQKRRVNTSLSGPIASNPKTRVRVTLDARRENWDLESTTASQAGVARFFTMSTWTAGADLQTILGRRTSLSNGFTITGRRFRFPSGASETNPSVFRTGTTLKYDAGLRQSFAIAESRMELGWSANSELGKLLGRNNRIFQKTSGTFKWQWLPQARGTDYRLSERLSAGAIAGTAPFDELYNLGMDRDNEFYLRGHSGTRNGEKGAGPLGSSYILSSSEVDKLVLQSDFWRLSLAPFLDTGRTFDDTRGLGSRWLWDAGIELRLTVFSRLTLSISYGRDLHSGRGAVFTNVTR